MKTKKSALSGKQKTAISAAIGHVVLLVVIVLMLYPVAFAVGASFKPQTEIFTNVLNFFTKNPTLDNFARAIERIDYFKVVWNTFAIAFCVMAFKVFTSYLCAYAFVFLNFPLKKLLYFVLISTMFIPFTVTMIPNYITISKMGLRDNIIGVMLPQLSDAMGIMLLRQQMRTIPRSLIEVGKLEKSSHFTIMTQIVLPIAKPCVISTAIIFFINSWNEYVWPRLILKTTDNYTLSLALQLFVDSEAGSGMGICMAMCVLTMLVPLVLFIIFQRQIMATYASSGIKG